MSPRLLHDLEVSCYMEGRQFFTKVYQSATYVISLFRLLSSRCTLKFLSYIPAMPYTWKLPHTWIQTCPSWFLLEAHDVGSLYLRACLTQWYPQVQLDFDKSYPLHLFSNIECSSHTLPDKCCPHRKQTTLFLSCWSSPKLLAAKLHLYNRLRKSRTTQISKQLSRCPEMRSIFPYELHFWKLRYVLVSACICIQEPATNRLSLCSPFELQRSPDLNFYSIKAFTSLLYWKFVPMYTLYSHFSMFTGLSRRFSAKARSYIPILLYTYVKDLVC